MTKLKINCTNDVQIICDHLISSLDSSGFNYTIGGKLEFISVSLVVSIEVISVKEEWVKEWKPMTSYYEKSRCDIILKNGDMILDCWPNAGYMHPCASGGNPKNYQMEELPFSTIAQVRLHIDN